MNKFNIPVVVDKLSNRTPAYYYNSFNCIKHFINDTNNKDYVIKQYSRFITNNIQFTIKYGINLRYKYNK